MEKKFNFQLIGKKAQAQGIDHKIDSKAAMKWFRDQAKDISYASPKKFQESATAFQNLQNLSINSIGKMYFFAYDPKWKEKLPYYDTFPLVFPIEMKSDRFLGLNMHYLSPYLRAQLMDNLYETMNNQKWNKTTKLQISYETLKGVSRFKYFKPTIHCYLFSHIQSPFRYIPPNMWDYVLCLPLQRFQKASAYKVWADSLYKAS